MNKELIGISAVAILLLIGGCENNKQPASSVEDEPSTSFVEQVFEPKPLICPKVNREKPMPLTTYQVRQDRWCEGQKSYNVSPVRINLISAFSGINPLNRSEPTQFVLKFYLKKSAPVSIIAQDFGRKGYLLDQVNPPPTNDAWSSEKFNEFKWPSYVAEELGLGIEDLGVLVCLDEHPKCETEIEEVAPAVFYYSDEPSKREYRFIFRSDNKQVSSLKYQIYQEDVEKPLLAEAKSLQQGKRSYLYEAIWDASHFTMEGYYKIVLEGKLGGKWGQLDGRDVFYSIRFYHKL